MAKRLPRGWQTVVILVRARLGEHAASRQGDTGTERYGVSYDPDRWFVRAPGGRKRDGEHMSRALSFLSKRGLILGPGPGAVTRHIRLTDLGRQTADSLLAVILPGWQSLPVEKCLYAGLVPVQVGGLTLWEPPPEVPPEPGTCRMCGATFDPASRPPRSQTCSPACSADLNREYQRQRIARLRAQARRERLEAGDLGGAGRPADDHPWRGNGD